MNIFKIFQFSRIYLLYHLVSNLWLFKLELRRHETEKAHLMSPIKRFFARVKPSSYLKFRQHRQLFMKMGGTITHSRPILSDFDDAAGTAAGHYFHQDLLVAQLIRNSNPKRHIDVGSRIDGFVAHVASFRKIEIIDIRPLKNSEHENIVFLQHDLMSDNVLPLQADSVSCLHAIEHFGLGRYGDRIDPDGHKLGFKNLVNMVAENGTLYISFPISNQNQVHFNAHRIFHPRDIFNWPGSEMLRLKRFDFVDESGKLNKAIELDSLPDKIKHGCGIYSFTKA